MPVGRRRAVVLGVYAVCVAGLLAGASTATSDGARGGSSTTASSATASSATKTSAAESSARSTTGTFASGISATGTAPAKTAGVTAAATDRQPVTLAFAGDTAFTGDLLTRVTRDPAGTLAPVADLLAGADLAVVNLETAITERGTPAPKEFTFRAPASVLRALLDAGVDVASMANNHGLDYGPEGLTDSLAAGQQVGLPLIGVGADEDAAYDPFIAEINGQRIAVIGATQVLDDQFIESWTATADHPGMASAKREDRLLAEVEKTEADADVVVVVLHWGVELDTCPTSTQQRLADRLVEAGADVVVGGHAHRLQGGGRLGDAVVHYGLGNFIFHAQSAGGTSSGVLLVTVAGGAVESYEWVPAQIQANVPRRLEGAAAGAARASWEALRGCTGLAP